MYKEFIKPEKSEDYWYSYQKIDSYDALMNFIIGARGDGKTYGFKEKCIINYFKTGRQGLYLRRTEKEIEKSKKKFINDIQGKYRPYRFKLNGDEMLCCEYDDINNEYIGEWEVVIHFAYLANSTIVKSVSYDKVDFICFDECIIRETKDCRYLNEEIIIFLDFYETVARMRDVKVYFLSNAVTQVNPYFFYFGISIPKPPNYFKRIQKEVVIEMIDDTKFKEHKKQTRFGQMIAGTEYEKYAVDNEFVIDSEDLMGKKTRDCFYWLTLYVDNAPFAIYCSSKDNRLFVSEDINLQVNARIETSLRNKYKSALSTGKRYQLNIIKFKLNTGNLFFETQRAKNIVGRLLEGV